MQSWKLLIVTSFTILAAGCGGGGGGGGSSSSASATTNPAPSTSYNFVAPTLNSQRAYTRTIVDNANNTINETITDQVTSVNTDGSFAVLSEDPNHNSITVNGTLYSVSTETVNVNNSDQETSYSYTPANGTPVTCTLTPHAAGPNYPLSIGETWSSSWNLTCGNNAPVTYTQTGSIVATESITVPAGTYTAIKLQSTVIWTDVKGTTHTDSRTTWRDANSSHGTIKEQNSYSYSGTIPTNGYPITVTTVLQKQS